MARSRRISPSRSNLVWLTVVVAAAAVGWILGGWKIALAAAVVGLVTSEIFERRARASRQLQ